MTDRNRVLYLDGNEEDRIEVAAVLNTRESGIELVETGGAAEFEERLGSGQWDLVLTEISADGYENLQVISETIGRCPGIPVVILTSGGSEEIAAEATQLGAFAYVIKSKRNIEKLPAILNRILEKRTKRTVLPRDREVLNKLMRNSGEMFVILDENAKEKFVSDSVERVTGYSPQGIEGGDAFNYLHPDDMEKMKKVFAYLISKPGATYRAEYRHKRKLGGWVHLEAVGTNFLDDPLINGIVVIVRDITERKEREERLLSNWKTLDKLVRNSNDLLIIMDEKGNELYVSQSAEKIIGYTAEEMTGQCCFDYFHPDDVPMIAEAFNRGINNPGVPQRIEYRRRAKDGSWLNLEAIGTSYLDDPEIAAIVVNARDISERLKYEQSIRKQGKIVDKLVRNSRVVLVILDVDGKEKYVSDSVERITGYSANELIGTSFFERLHEDDNENVLNVWKAVLNDPEKVHQIEYRRMMKNGGWVYLEAVFTNKLDDPDVRGIVINAWDITPRKESEKRVLESNERFQRLAGLLPEGVWEADLEGTIQYVNKKGLDMLGYTEEDIKAGVNGFDFYSMPGRQKCIERTMAVLNGDTSRITEYEMKRKDGSTFPALIHSELVRINGEPAYFIGIGIDISERKKAELEQLQLVAAIEQARETVVITDSEGVIIYVNPAFEMISGYSREEAIGQNPRILQSGEHSTSFYRSMWKVLTAGKTWQGTFLNKKKGGRLYNEQATISPVFDELGEIVNYVAVKRDITEQLRVNREKAELEKQYHQAQKMETVGLLAGGIAHDLNNLLTPILGYSEMIVENPKATDSSRNYAGIVLKAARGARDIVSRLLAFSRRQALDMQSVDLNQLVKDFQKKLERIVTEEVAVKFAFSEDLPEILGDPAQLEQVMTDLAHNARDAMPGGGTLTIETALTELTEDFHANEEILEPGVYATLVVSDTGLGMDVQTKSQIFEPFFTTKPLDKGSGLGLATSYGIVRQHGGDIRVFSQPMKGSTFRILLPAVGDSILGASEDPASRDSLKGKELILIVEDDDHVREMSKSVLARRGYQVLTAETGEDALELLRDNNLSIDLLLTDVVMPGINGRELYDLAAPAQPEMQVIYMSGYAGEVLVARGITSDGINFIQKPFSVQSLTNKIRTVLDLKSMRADPPTE